MTTTTFSPSAKIALLQQAVRTQPRSAALLRELSEALVEAGREREAADMFRRAYLLEPDICTRTLSCVDSDNAGRLRTYSRSLIANGVAYAPVIATLAIAEAHLGNGAEVQRLVDYDRLFRTTIMEPPSGCDRNSFCDALANEIKSDLKFHDTPPGRAIRRAWRHHMSEPALPASQAWAKAIRHEVDRYIATLPKMPDHPFWASRPADYVLDAWAVVSDGASHHLSHIHPRAWLSGVYYVVRPAVSHDASRRQGWLTVGPPEQRYGVTIAHGWAARTIAPEPGQLALMPAYFYHGTQPMGVNEERICIAFDVVPRELAGGNLDSDEI